MNTINAIGRRKSSVARIYVNQGKGNITINKRDLNNYFTVDTHRYIVTQPLVLLNFEGQYDIKVNLNGGGLSGQAQALQLAISRALVKIDSENKPKLKTNGFLTRDSRIVERKKPGRPKARKKFQFSKR